MTGFPVITMFSPGGNWEGHNVLRVVKDEASVMQEHDLKEGTFYEKLDHFKQKALQQREGRTRPGLDNKVIAGWNGLALTGLSDAYQAVNDSLFLELATANARFISEKLIKNGRLLRFADKDLEGFLEDYAAVIQGFIRYYETTFDAAYLELARQLTERANAAFFDEEEGLYFFTSDASEQLIARKKELFDNVIPSSNSLMCHNLIHLGTHYYDEELLKRGKRHAGTDHRPADQRTGIPLQLGGNSARAFFALPPRWPLQVKIFRKRQER